MKSKALGFLAAALLATPISASAIVITISGQGSADGQWDVTTLVGTYDTLLSALDDQVWWSNQPLTDVFATSVGTALGFPNTAGPLAGPVFAYSPLDSFFFNACAYLQFLNDVSCGATTRSVVWTFAVASRDATVPEPGTVALLGIGLAALGLSRRRKAA